MDIGNKIKTYRESLGLSIRQFAMKCNISPSYLGVVERNETSPTVDKLKLICDYLGITLNDFFSDKEKPIIQAPLRNLVKIAKELSDDEIKQITKLIKTFKK